MTMRQEHHTSVPENRAPASMTLAAYTILPACIFFNFLLCFVHTKIAPVSVGLIMASEMVIIATAIAYGFFRIDRAKLFWIGLLSIQVVLILLLSAGKGELQMKSIRDMMIVSVFVVLGLSCWRVDLTKLLLWLATILVAIALFEAFIVDTFLKYFNIRSYYIDKGAMADKEITDIAVFASGVRPNERFLFGFIDFHRISSAFLEPVSFGFYAFVSGAYFVAVKKHIRKAPYIAGLAMAYLCIWLSDARMAFGALTIMILCRPLFERIHPRMAMLVFPVALIFSIFVYISGIFDVEGEGIGARLHHTVQLLLMTDPELLFGLSYYPYGTEDSALTYLLQNQGLIGFLLFWLAPILFVRRLKPEAAIYLFAIAIFTSFGFMLSSAIFTIKTMALMWFIFGYLVARYHLHNQS